MAEEERQVEPMVEDSTPVVHRGIPNYPTIEVPPAPEKVATMEANGPRLMITQIVNEFFKSYAGVTTLGPFHKSFSSIVGPNGSGKSNVIDSMLFVFGYRANKLRSKKISVLIHNSEEHKNVQSCTVSVHFQKIIDTGVGENDFDVVPNSKFVVSRTAFRDNSSYYKVDNKKATYKEVAALLRGHGIDLDHNRFLILQGEVEQIAMMKAKGQTEHDEGMLEFLEDIIGSNRFKEPIEMLANRVEELNELRSEKLNRVRAVEKEKNELEGVKNEAVEYLTIENDIAKIKNKICQKYILECSELVGKSEEKKNQVNEGMKEMNSKMSELVDGRKEKQKENKALLKKYEAVNAEMEALKEKFSEFESQDVKMREEMKHSKVKGKKLDKALEAEKTKLEDLQAIPKKTEHTIEQLEKKLDSLKADHEKEEAKLKEVMEGLKTETKPLQLEKEAKETELAGLQKGVNDAKSKYTVSQSEHDLYMSNQRAEKMKLDRVQASLERATEQLKVKQTATKEFETKLPETEEILKKSKHDLEKATATEEKLLNEVKETRVKVETARSSLSAHKSKNRVIDSLMQQKKSGKLPGIIGRLGDLGAIDQKYDVAISTACRALDNIVVDKVVTAQDCVAFLKKNGVGVATFIGLDKMEKWKPYCSKKITTPENVPRLFDLIEVQDPSLLTAFYFVLRDTLVAKNLEQATRIAYGATRYRVVTLTGDLIETSGSMSGGGKQVCRGLMGSSLVADVDPKELDRMERKLEKDTSDAQICKEHKAKLEDVVDKQQRNANEMKHGLTKFTVEIKGLTEQVEHLKEQVNEQAQRYKDAAPDEKTLKKLERTTDGYKKDYEKVAAVSSKIEDEVHELHNKIMDIGGSKLKAAETRINMVQAQIDQVTGHITKNKVSIKTAHRNTKKCEDKIVSVEEEIKENSENLIKLKKDFEDLNEKGTKVIEKYQKSQEDMKEGHEILEQKKAEIDKIEEEETSLQKEHMEVKHELEKYDNLVKENQAKVKHWKKELGRLSLHPIDNKEEETLPTIPAEELKELVRNDQEYLITVAQENLAKMKPNMAAIAEYRKKEEMYLKRVGELDEITDLRDLQRRTHEEMRKQRLDEFMKGFSSITEKLKEMYQMITLGGDAELELVDSLDPFSEGIVFSVRPPKKSWKNISSLSGGEKTLSSLSLVFALHHYKPTPLYVMDEIDAALDFKNVSIVANYIKERTKNAQFIIISLRNNMFELADRLIGIFKTHNCTKSVTINPQKISMFVETPDSRTNS